MQFLSKLVINQTPFNSRKYLQKDLEIFIIFVEETILGELNFIDCLRFFNITRMLYINFA